MYMYWHMGGYMLNAFKRAELIEAPYYTEKSLIMTFDNNSVDKFSIFHPLSGNNSSTLAQFYY